MLQLEQAILKTHIESKHVGIKYPCSNCEYVATTAGYLKRHFKMHYKRVIYPCSECEYVATRA